MAGPLIVNNLCIAGMQFADTVMSGMLGTQDLAGVAVGAQVWYLALMINLGLMMAISPIAARYFGSDNLEKIGVYTQQGLLLAVISGIFFFTLVQVFVVSVMDYFYLDKGFKHLAIDYVRAVMFGAPALYAFFVLRFTTEGIGFTRPIMYASAFSFLCNIFLNWVFMFGKFGFKAYGAMGCGIASAITCWLLLIVMIIYFYKKSIYKPLKIFYKNNLIKINVLKEILFLGGPISGAIVAESGFFSAVTLLVGTRGTEILAAHQIAVNFASTMFMVPLALGAATTIRIGHALGSKNPLDARLRGISGIFFSAIFMFCSATFMLFFGKNILEIYTADSVVINIGITLLFMAAIFQIADGIQISAAGALRGYKDTRIPMFINIFSYWALGFPLAYLATITFRASPPYIWGAFLVGLTVAAILLPWRFNRISIAHIKEA